MAVSAAKMADNTAHASHELISGILSSPGFCKIVGCCAHQKSP
jgi:hypothetical protein